MQAGEIGDSALRLAVVIEWERFRNHGQVFSGVRRLMILARIADWRTFTKARAELQRFGLRWQARSSGRYAQKPFEYYWK